MDDNDGLFILLHGRLSFLGFVRICSDGRKIKQIKKMGMVVVVVGMVVVVI